MTKLVSLLTAVPKLDVRLASVPATSNPLGAKGVGEVDLTGALAATVNAVDQALAPGSDITLPLTENRI